MTYIITASTRWLGDSKSTKPVKVLTQQFQKFTSGDQPKQK